MDFLVLDFYDSFRVVILRVREFNGFCRSKKKIEYEDILGKVCFLWFGGDI